MTLWKEAFLNSISNKSPFGNSSGTRFTNSSQSSVLDPLNKSFRIRKFAAAYPFTTSMFLLRCTTSWSFGALPKSEPKEDWKSPRASLTVRAACRFWASVWANVAEIGQKIPTINQNTQTLFFIYVLFKR